MEHKPHDTLAKLVLSVIAPHREQLAEVELRLPAYGDILLRPGPPLDPVVGLLQTLVGARQVLLEFFSGRPKLPELIRIRAKGFSGVVLELLRKTDFAVLELSAIIIVGNGHSKRALDRAWLRCRWEQVSQGVHRAAGWPEAYYVDLLRLPVTPSSSWLHLAGNSVWVEEALRLLQSSPDEQNTYFLSRLSEEVPHMALQTHQGEEQANRRFLAAWEAQQNFLRGQAEGEARGRAQGEAIGRAQGARRILQVLLTSRFGETALPMLERLSHISEPEVLESLATQAVHVHSLDEMRLPD